MPKQKMKQAIWNCRIEINTILFYFKIKGEFSIYFASL